VKKAVPAKVEVPVKAVPAKAAELVKAAMPAVKAAETQQFNPQFN